MKSAATSARTVSGARTRALVAAVAIALAGACSTGKSDDAVDTAHAAALDHDHECAACGMVVAEQPAPRAQLVHRDGTRQYFCSIGDMLAYIDAPSQHGAVVASFVETMDPAADPNTLSVDERPWKPAEQASYLLGIERRVMGIAVMVYDTEAEARSIAAKHAGEVLAWDELRAKRLPASEH